MEKRAYMATLLAYPPGTGEVGVQCLPIRADYLTALGWEPGQPCLITTTEDGHGLEIRKIVVDRDYLDQVMDAVRPVALFVAETMGLGTEVACGYDTADPD